MLTYIIYFSIFVILVFVLTIAVKAITRGVEAKQILKDEKNFEANKESAKTDKYSCSYFSSTCKISYNCNS